MTTEQKTFYTNALEVATTAYDINLKFIRNGAPTLSREEKKQIGSGDMQVKAQELDSIVISMSAHHAKAMLPSIVMAVRDYEKAHGALGIPDNLQKLYTDIFGK